MKTDKWRIGFEHPAVRADIWNRYPGSIPIVAPAAPFAFGQVVALATNMEIAALIAKAPELLEMLSHYIDVMEDYPAGFPITDPAHPHHEDWTKAKALLAEIR